MPDPKDDKKTTPPDASKTEPETVKPPFVHLHTHSHYSLLQALSKVDDMVKKAKKLGMDAVTLTDNGNLYGAIEFFKECDKQGIKGIIGVDFFVAARTRHDKEPRIDNRTKKLVLLAENLEGYYNLVQLVTKSNLEGFYYRPRIDRELIEQHKAGLIAILPSFGGEVANAIRTGNRDDARMFIEQYRHIFNVIADGNAPSDPTNPTNMRPMTDAESADPATSRLFVEITRHEDIENHDQAMTRVEELATEMHVPTVAAHNIFYLNKDDKKARTTLLSVQKSFGAAAEDDDGDFSFLSAEEMQNLFTDMPEAIANTRIIADRCNVKVKLGDWVFPNIDIDTEVIKNPDGSIVKNAQGATPYDDELRRLVYEGFEKRNVEKNEDMLKRAEYELEVIRNKGYAPYFLVVADLLRFSKENKILSNIRGSVSGSLVTFLAGITNINPIEYAIPFERFLNPDRPSAPDIDMDFADDRRDEVVEYARQKYGRDKVAQIGTFGTMAARGSVRDVTRALGFHVSVGDRIAKMIPMGKQGFPMTIELALEQVPELKEIYDTEADVKRIIDMAKKIEGCARHISVHAAGVVISPTEITNYTPLQYDTKGESKVITQYDMYSIEDAGLLKFDFLGLKNLSIIADTLDLIEKRHGIYIDLDTIDLNDQKTYDMLQRGDTEDLFQLNGDGMTRFLKELKPTNIHDINAMVALYRPGPLQFIPDYIARKHDASKIPDIDPDIYKILEPTFGVLVYQDDLLMMAHMLAGYSWGEVDKFRKAVGKKIPEEMALQKEKFIKGCMSHSRWTHARGEEVWKWIEPFAAYGFNKAHSVSYGRIAYITAYLKANFLAEYMSAVLTHESGDIEKIAVSVRDCERLGVPVLPPDINESFTMFTVVDQVVKELIEQEVPDPADPNGNTMITTKVEVETKKPTIRFGLNCIKNFGEGIATAIIDERETSGKFRSIEDFLMRVRDKNLNKKSLESLIKAGALDAFEDRGVMMHNLESLLHFNKEQQKNLAGQVSLFAGLTDMATGTAVDGLRLVQQGKVDKSVELVWEKELIGLFVSGHPLDKYRHIFEKREDNIEKIKRSIIEEGHKYGDENARPVTVNNGNGGRYIKKESYARPVIAAGIIEEIKEIPTKKDPTQKLLFMRVADFSGSIEMVVFPKIYTQYKSVLVPDACVVMRAKTSFRNESPSLILDSVRVLV
jgi:DNA polymerase-3 subunit alpha